MEIGKLLVKLGNGFREGHRGGVKWIHGGVFVGHDDDPGFGSSDVAPEQCWTSSDDTILQWKTELDTTTNVQKGQETLQQKTERSELICHPAARGSIYTTVA